MRCPNCGARMNRGSNVCFKCGTKLSQIQEASHKAVKQARAEFEPEKVVYTTCWANDLNHTKTLLFCIFLGLFGAHYFYVKRPVPGIIFAVCWSLFILFYAVSYFVLGPQNGYPSYDSYGMQMLSVFVAIMGALVFIYWIADIFKIAFKKFKVPVVLKIK